MLNKPLQKFSRPASRLTLTSKSPNRRTLFNTPSKATNRIYDSVRNPSDLETLLLLSSSSRTSLIILWKTSLCRSCAVISPMIQSIIESSPNGFGGHHVGYTEVELDAPDATELAMQYGIRSIPTLMAFDRREAQMETMIINVEKMKSERFLREWIEKEALRGGQGGAGGSFLGSLFGGGT